MSSTLHKFVFFVREGEKKEQIGEIKATTPQNAMKSWSKEVPEIVKLGILLLERRGFSLECEEVE